MSKKLLQVIVLFTSGLVTTDVLAHGDHSIMTADHGLEHVFYYGIGIVAGLILFNAYRTVKSKNRQK